jgi:hypothetical protein
MVAVCHLLDSGVRPKIGTLTLSFANVAAYETLRSGEAVRKPADHAQPEPDLVVRLARRQRRQRRAAPRARDAAGRRRRRPHPRHPFDEPRRRAVLGLSGVRAQRRGRASARRPEVHLVMPAGLGSGTPLIQHGRTAGRRHGRALVVECGQHFKRRAPISRSTSRCELPRALRARRSPRCREPRPPRRFELLRTHVIQNESFASRGR